MCTFYSHTAMLCPLLYYSVSIQAGLCATDRHVKCVEQRIANFHCCRCHLREDLIKNVCPIFELALFVGGHINESWLSL